MNTDNNQPTRLTANAHEEQKTANTNQMRILRNEAEYQAALAESLAEPSDPMRYDPWLFPDPPVCAYSRKQALADGREMRVTTEFMQQMRERWSITTESPVFLRKSVIEACEIASGRSIHNDTAPLERIICALDEATECTLLGWGSPIVSRIPFEVSIRSKSVCLNLAWSTADIDDPQSSFTVMLPQED